ncbi:MAG TPA: LacI family DNA-binding transcriptional regulator [Chthoniobacteraceae bacterium]|jgi:LacI family transcriptional regulator
MKPTIRQISALAGCSPSAASLALRESPQISPAMRARVQKAAQQLGYEANPLLSGLMRDRRIGKGSGAVTQPHEKRVSMRDLAAAVGCGHGAVSRTFRNASGVSPELRSKIRQVAGELGYQTDAREAAAAAARRSSFHLSCSVTIGFINLFSDLQMWRSFPSFTRFVEGAAERAAQLGCELEEFHYAAKGMTPQRLTQILRSRGIQGLIIGSAPSYPSHVRLGWSHFSSAAQALSVVRPNLSRAAANYAQCVHLATRKLRHLGYGRIGMCVRAETDLRCGQLLSGAYEAQMLRTAHEDRVPIFGLSSTDDEEAFAGWFRAHRPAAIINNAFPLVDWLRNLSVRVPEDVGLALLGTHQGHPQEHAESKGWAGVDQRLEATGAAAMDLVFEQLISNQRGIPRAPKTVLIDGQWADGWTVASRATRVRPLATWQRKVRAAVKA